MPRPSPRSTDPSRSYIFWMNYRYTFAEYYSALFIILSILRYNRDHWHLPLCTSAQWLVLSPDTNHRCHILFDRGRFLPNVPRYFRQQIYSTDIYEREEEEIPSRSRKKLDLGGGCKDFNKTLRDRFAILEENLSISRNRDTINNEIIISLVFFLIFLRISGYFDKYSTS